MKYNPFLAAVSLLLPFSLVSCGVKSGERIATVSVSNETPFALGSRTVEIEARPILEKLNSKAFYVTDTLGNRIPSQLTYDSRIIFNVDVPEGETYRYFIHPSDTMPKYTATVGGDFYPKRRDDVAYENELVGFRIYGPGTQKVGEKSFGYDIFLKHTSPELIVPQLYAAQTDDANWAKVDSLRKIDPKLAHEFEDSFSYHIDHGKGMDCYAVGATLGDGVAAIIDNDAISYPWCYETAEILDNGPLRFTLALNFAPRKIGSAENVTEHRLITLDSQSHLNDCLVWYEGLDGDNTIVTGFPLRDESGTVIDEEKGIIAYADPTQGQDNGKALVGVMYGTTPDSIMKKENHLLMSRTLSPSDTLSYKWGFAWDRMEIGTIDAWKNYLDNSLLNYTVSY